MNLFIVISIIVLWLSGTLVFVSAGIISAHRPGSLLKKDYTHQPTVSILLPAYNEGQAVYETIRSIHENSYPKQKLEVIAIDDRSGDDTWSWVQRAETDFADTTIRAIRNEKNLGKTGVLLKALHLSQASIVMVVDSDTELHSDALCEVMACFKDPKMGMVGIPASVKNPNVNSLTVYQNASYYSGFRAYRVPACAAKAVGCIGGFASAIRRELFLEIEPALVSRRFLGCEVHDGEDRYMTHLAALAGYQTYQDSEARCWTAVPTEHGKYWGQQMRWRRTFVRDFIFTVQNLWAHTDLHPALLHQYIIMPLALIVAGVDIVLIAVTGGGLVWFDFRMVLMYLSMSFVAMAVARRLQPDQSVQNPLRLLVFAPWAIVNSLLLTVAASLSLDNADWGNRPKIKKEKIDVKN